MVGELEKVGDRLHYELLSGQGPKVGWVPRPPDKWMDGWMDGWDIFVLGLNLNGGILSLISHEMCLLLHVFDLV